MANKDAAFGFRPVGHLDGSPWNGVTQKCWFPAGDGTATFVGDIVKLDGTGDSQGNMSVIIGAAGDTPVGVVVGFEPNPDDLTQVHRIASQNITYQNAGRWARVATSPDLVMEVQGTGTALITSIGSNIDLAVGTGDADTGLSAAEIDFATDANTSTLVFTIIGAVVRPDNDPAIANANWLVCYNVHQFGSVGTTGTAV